MGCLYQIIVEIILEGVLELLTSKEKRKEFMKLVKEFFRPDKDYERRNEP